MNYKEVIWKELGIWQRAYPKEADLLKKFASKIKLEIELQTNLDAQTPSTKPVSPLKTTEIAKQSLTEVSENIVKDKTRENTLQTKPHTDALSSVGSHRLQGEDKTGENAQNTVTDLDHHTQYKRARKSIKEIPELSGKDADTFARKMFENEKKVKS